jgi:putative salt-induced outer membrane protein YdiY
LHRLLLFLPMILLAAVMAHGQDGLGLPMPQELDPGVERLPPVGPEPPFVSPLLEAELPPLDALPPGRLTPVPLLEDDPPPVKLWQGSVEMGLNGASGNTESSNFHFACNARRRTAMNGLTLQLDYFRQSDHSENTANRLFHDWRLEHYFLGSPWTCYVHGTVEYDEFAAYDTRITTDTGVGYRFLDTETTFLIARCGAGVSREFGGPNDDFTPEGVFGLDFQHRIGIRHRLVVSAEYRPDITAFSHYRINSQAGWEFLLDQQINLSLKLGVLDRYDSTPEGKKPNDLNYGVVLLWKF